MFMDIAQTTRSELDVVDQKAGLFSDPPDGLLAALAWEGPGEDQVTVLMVWETPGARGDFGFQRMMPLMESGEVTAKPEILTPYKTFLRGTGPDAAVAKLRCRATSSARRR
jgi:hypothetical protein